MRPESLSAIDSVDIDRYGYIQAESIVDAGDGWVVIELLQGEYNMMFLNTDTGEQFRAIRRGRGPGECIEALSLHRLGEDACMSDGRAFCFKIRIRESIEERKVVMDTIARFGSGEFRSYMTSCGEDRFISGHKVDRNIWYALFDENGKMLSSVSAWNYLSQVKDDGDARSVVGSAKYVTNRAGDRVCVANVMVPSLSFSSVVGNRLEEYRRIEIEPDYVFWHLSEDMVRCFSGLDADEKHVYVLYSGLRVADASFPSYECRHLLVYDWAGEVKHHYMLDKSVMCISISGDTLLCASTYPAGRIYKYRIPE